MVFNTALSGINAATKDLDVIGNNIANAATIGFKSSRAEFADVYATSYLGGGSNAIGGGVQLSRVQQNFGKGPINFTNNSLDLAIAGSGFFALSDQGARVYSRAGAFGVSNDNYVENSAKQRLIGYQADANGNITTNVGDLSINRADIPAQATTAVDAGFNLKQNDAVKTIAWAGGASPSADSYNYSSSATIYDSFGNAHTLTMYFIKADPDAAAGAPNAASPAGTHNQWYVAFQIDNQDVPALGGATNSANLYRVNFNDNGTFNNVQDTTNTNLPNNQIPLTQNLNNGSAVLNFTVDLATSTQFGSASGTQMFMPNGNTTGRLDSLFIDKNGVLLGGYTNGESRAMGQILLSNFANPNGLQPIGGNNWVETSDSGQPLNGVAGTGSLGLIQSGALEGSNVDLTGELINLISAQRNFQANAQTIRTADAVTQTIINIR